MQTTPEQLQQQQQRRNILERAGINPRDQHIAVHTLRQVQAASITQCEVACVHYLRKWVPELAKVKPEHFTRKLSDLNANFSALFKAQEPLLGKNSLTYGLARKYPNGRVETFAFEITFTVTPQLGKSKGIFRLDVDHKEIPFPANVKVIDAKP